MGLGQFFNVKAAGATNNVLPRLLIRAEYGMHQVALAITGLVGNAVVIVAGKVGPFVIAEAALQVALLGARNTMVIRFVGVSEYSR